MSVTKISSRKVERNFNYATAEDLAEELRAFERNMGWSIFDIFEILKQRKTDSFSMTKEKPFHYFYARLKEKTIIVRLQTSQQEIEFELPLEKIKE